MENWAFAAPPNLNFTLTWKANFRRALEVGAQAYVSSIPESVTGSILQGQDYLDQHVAYRQTVLELNPQIQLFAPPAEANMSAVIRLMRSDGATR
jgi:hypothetical protein